MKNIKILCCLTMVSILSGCLDVLDKDNLTSVSGEIWNSEGQAEMYVNNLYLDNMPGMSIGKNSDYSDECASTSNDLLYGAVQSVDFDTYISGDYKETMCTDTYKDIRQINICIDGLKQSTLKDSIRNTLLGQALFFRAYRYWEMVKIYGGVPMVMYVQDPFTENLDVPRNKTSECIDLIVADLDLAIEYLPIKWASDDIGRITSGAAAAYKGRVLLHYASPLFNRDNDEQYWQNAYEANMQAINILEQAGNGLLANFEAIFTTDAVNNPEAVFFRQYRASVGSDYQTNIEQQIRPKSGGGDGKFTPTWNLVKAFPMANGKSITDPASGYDSTYYWQNRDPRFYATIGYNGSIWPMEGKETDVLWTYDEYYGENRTRNKAFYCKKASDYSIPADQVSLGSTTWHELRYAEVLLNFAECANEIGKSSEAIDKIIEIRSRAGIEAVNGNYGIPENASKATLREIIMQERQVEFAFENKRYWDIRRWLLFRNDLGPNTPKLNGSFRYYMVTQRKSEYRRLIVDDPESKFNGWNVVDTAAYLGHIDINNSEVYNQYFTTELKIIAKKDMSTQAEMPISYLPLYDFFAIPQQMLDRSDSIQQTVGWFDGHFDPFE